MTDAVRESRLLGANILVYMADSHVNAAVAAEERGDKEEADRRRASAESLRGKAVAAKILAAL